MYFFYSAISKHWDFRYVYLEDKQKVNKKIIT